MEQKERRERERESRQDCKNRGEGQRNNCDGGSLLCSTIL